MSPNDMEQNEQRISKEGTSDEQMNKWLGNLDNKPKGCKRNLDRT